MAPSLQNTPRFSPLLSWLLTRVRRLSGRRVCNRCGARIPRGSGYRLSRTLSLCDAHAWLLLIRRHSEP